MIFGGNEFSKTDEDYQYPLQYLLYRSGYTIWIIYQSTTNIGRQCDSSGFDQICMLLAHIIVVCWVSWEGRQLQAGKHIQNVNHVSFSCAICCSVMTAASQLNVKYSNCQLSPSLTTPRSVDTMLAAK